MLIERGIEANPDKCAALIRMRSPATVKEVQQLTGRMAALSRFLSASGDKGYPYFQCLKKNNRFLWTLECEEAFVKLKAYLASPPVLGKLVHDVPLHLKVLQEPEERYQAIEKAALADVFTARRLRHYFHNFTVIVMIDLPIRKVLQTPDIAGRLVRWSVEQSKFDIQYEPRGLIKSQVYTDFVVELLFGGPNPDPKGFQCILSVGGSFNQQGNRAGVILEGPNDLLIEESLKFAFKTSNNKAEYEALIAEMLLAQELGAQNLLVKSDSLLVTEQVTGRYQAKDPQLAAYLRYVTLLKDAFAEFDLVHVPREQNSQADLLPKLASLGKGNRQKSVI
ncbi:uncharacterized protein [Phaseolus vulgaris]|uniref:uncharacterized protein n=1 Tax=Phaseolus vulgaris TaxID=3885 RepID=UPI0035C9A24B